MTTTSGPLAVGPLVLGGNVFGWTADAPTSHAILDAFVAAGGRSVDTADAYSRWIPGHVGGESERVLGEWVAANGPGTLEIATKVAKLDRRPGLARENVRAALGDSLERLRLEVLDLYYAHQDDESQTPEQIASTFGELVTEGRVRAWGLSNVTPQRVRAIVAAARAAGTPAPTYSQDRWSLVERGIEHELLPTLRELQLIELPYSALASGFLSGKYRPGRDVESARAGAAGRYLERAGAEPLLAELDGVATAHGVGVAAVALAWLRSRPGVGAPIASARTLEQLDTLVESFALSLDEEQLSRLDDASAALGPAPARV